MKKHKLLKRALAALLTLTMALGIVPMTAFAQETSQAAQEAAAMRALESRVFILGGEEKTIEDLEQAAAVIVVTETGDLTAVSGSEIREYLIANPRRGVDGDVTFKITRTTSMSGYITAYAVSNSNKIKKVEGQLYCQSTESGTYYYKNPSSGKTTLWQESSTSPAAYNVTFQTNNFQLPSLINYYVGINDLNMIFEGTTLTVSGSRQQLITNP